MKRDGLSIIASRTRQAGPSKTRTRQARPSEGGPDRQVPPGLEGHACRARKPLIASPERPLPVFDGRTTVSKGGHRSQNFGHRSARQGLPGQQGL